MNYKVVERNSRRYILCDSTDTPLGSEQDSLDLVAACGENDTNLILLHSGAISDDFFKLRTGLAGKVLQKFINYRIRAAVVLTNEQKITGKFKEVIAETSKGNDFRVFDRAEEAEKWLLSL